MSTTTYTPRLVAKYKDVVPARKEVWLHFSNAGSQTENLSEPRCEWRYVWIRNWLYCD